jgi:hypothetical protein
MAKLLSALVFAAALLFGLGASSSPTYACNEQSAQATDATGLIQLAMDDADDSSSDDSSSDDGSSDDSSSDDGSSDDGDAADE